MRAARGAAALALLVGCRASEAPHVDAAPTWLGFEAEHWLPGPRRADRASTQDRGELERRCRACHEAQARDWSTSQHASAWSSAAFTRAYAAEPLAFCRDCHAPEGEALADLGIACVTCHVEPGQEVIWTAGDALEPARAGGCALPVARSPAFAGVQVCAGCHEFAFPDARVRDEVLMMQSTIREHRESSAARQACADCHMPQGRSHAFVGADDPEMLRRSLVVEARREGDAIVIALRPGWVGHAVPTGDLFRRLEVSLLARDDGGEERVLARRWLGRRFGPGREHGLTLEVELEDSRVGPSGQTLRFAVPADVDAGSLRWTVVHQRVVHVGSDPGRAMIDGQLELASGVIAGASADAQR